MVGPNFLFVVLVAFALGLRHALDPDHLIAVTTLVAGDDESASRAGRLGITWGAGHAIAVVVLGLPVVIAGPFLPTSVQRAAETAVGVVIVVLGLRIVHRWRRGHYHVHQHAHDDVTHSHVHGHLASPAHAHEHARPRTPLQAFLIGVTHGIGGSAAVTLLLLASVPSRTWASIALVVFAAGTAASMGVASAAFSWLLGREPLRRRIRVVVVPLGVASLGFGVLYAAGAWTPLLAVG